MVAVEQAELVARRRSAQYELVSVLGGPSRWHHAGTDQLLDRMGRVDVVLSGAVEVIRWR